MKTNDDDGPDGKSHGEVARNAILDCPGWRRRHGRYGYGPEFEMPDREDGAAQRSLPDWLA
jgi:hypothetical protein